MRRLHKHSGLAPANRRRVSQHRLAFIRPVKENDDPSLLEKAERECARSELPEKARLATFNCNGGFFGVFHSILSDGLIRKIYCSCGTPDCFHRYLNMESL